MALSTAQTRRAWSAYKCNRKGWLEIVFLGRSPVRIIDICADAWAACEQALKATGYTSADIVGSYNCRGIVGGNLSLHAYRCAIDIDPRKNWKHLPFSKTKITRRNVVAVEAIRTRNGQRVFTSGSRFADNMHIQIACGPGDIATGIDHRTVKGHSAQSHEDAPQAHRDGSVAASPTIHLGAHGGAVEKLQAALNALGDPDPHLDVDGRFGTKTRTALRSYQRAHQLTVDGVAGPKTWRQIDEV